MNNLAKNQSKVIVKDLVLAITYRCNAHCSFCHIWQSKKDFSLKSIDYQKLPQNIRNVNISGGEPFLRNDLPEIIRVISHRCPKAQIIISTNGFAPRVIKEQMQKIIKIKRDIGVAVSLDGFGKVHEELRGFKGGFSLVLETIHLLKELKIKSLKVAFTLNQGNANQLRRIYRLSQELGIEFSLAFLHNSSHYFQKEDNKINYSKKIYQELGWLIKRELKSFSFKKWLRAYFAWGAIKMIRDQQRVLPDYSGLTSLFIDPFGKIYPSDVWDLPLGQLKSINDWSVFSAYQKKIISSRISPPSWMICTARQSIKKHWLQVGYWIIKTKIFGLRENLAKKEFAISKKTI